MTGLDQSQRRAGIKHSGPGSDLKPLGVTDLLKVECEDPCRSQRFWPQWLEEKVCHSQRWKHPEKASLGVRAEEGGGEKQPY